MALLTSTRFLMVLINIKTPLKKKTFHEQTFSQILIVYIKINFILTAAIRFLWGQVSSHKNWVRSVQPFLRLFDINKYTEI